MSATNSGSARWPPKPADVEQDLSGGQRSAGACAAVWAAAFFAALAIAAAFGFLPWRFGAPRDFSPATASLLTCSVGDAEISTSFDASGWTYRSLDQEKRELYPLSAGCPPRWA